MQSGLSGAAKRWFALFALVYMTTYAATDSGARGDGYYTYQMLESVLADGDLDLKNQFAAHGNPWRYKPDANTGYYHMRYEAWPPLFWGPSFFVARAVVTVANTLGAKLDPDPGSLLHQRITLVASPLAALAGAWALLLLLARWHDETVALLCAMASISVSHLAYYTLFNPSYAHPLSFACAAWMLERLDAVRRRPRLRDYAWLGTAIGLAVLVRPDAVVLSLAPALVLLAELVAGRADLKQTLLRGVTTLGPVIAGVLPTLWLFDRVFGSPFSSFQGPHFMRWEEPWLLSVWFASSSGLFVWTPSAWLGVFGWLVMLKRPAFRTIAFACIGVFLLGSYVNACAWDWWGGAAFGARRASGLWPMLVAGQGFVLSAALDWITRQPRRAAVACLGVALAFAMLAQYSVMRGSRYGKLEPSRPSTLSQRLGRVGTELGADVESIAGDPFSWPANWLFAIAHRADPSLYSCVVGRRFLMPESATLRYGKAEVVSFAEGADSCLLAHGFSTARQGTRTLTGPRARVLLPVFRGTDLSIRLEASGAAGCSVRVALDGQALGELSLTTTPTVHSLAASAAQVDSGVLDLDLFPSQPGCARVHTLRIAAAK